MSTPRISPLRTDAYQYTMIAGYFLRGIHNQKATFNAFYRKSPLGEYAIFAGLRKIMHFLETFSFTEREIEFLRSKGFSSNPKFYEYLKEMHMNDVTVYSVREGTMVFPKVPILKVEGPLVKVQLIETILLSLINYSTLVATYASRLKHIIGEDKKLLEFGLRRCPGIGSGFDASEAAYIGGADGTSNVEAEIELGIPFLGTVAHSFVQNHEGLNPNDHDFTILCPLTNDKVNLWKEVNTIRAELGEKYLNTSDHELVAFVSSAQSDPTNFVALLDTIDTLKSGILNFIVVAKALLKLGYVPKGVRLDSGDLAYLSKEITTICDEAFKNTYKPTIIASNDLSIEVVKSLIRQGATINVYAVGTNLVNPMTYKGALGAVYKASMRESEPLMKHSESITKVSFPGNYLPYRLYNRDGHPYIDLLVLNSEKEPKVGESILCLDPFNTHKKCYFKPSKVECLLQKVWSGKPLVKVDPHTSRERSLKSLSIMREDHIRDENPTPFKFSMTTECYRLLHSRIEAHSTIPEIY